MNPIQQCLRPPVRLLPPRSAATKAFYGRFYSVARAVAKTEAHANNTTGNVAESLQIRAEALLKSGRELYPRFPKDATVKTTSCRMFLGRFGSLAKDQTAADVELALSGMFKTKMTENIILIIPGRVKSIRISGSNLAFIDFTQDGYDVQAVCVQKNIEASGSSGVQFRDLLRQIRRGDIYSKHCIETPYNVVS